MRIDFQAAGKLIGRVISWIRGIFTKGTQPFWLQQREFRERCVKLLWYYQGVQKLYLQDIVQKRAPRNGPEIVKYLDVHNIVAFITDQVAQTFKYGVSVQAVNSADQEAYSDIVEGCKFDALVQELERKLFLLRQLYVKVFWSESEGCVCLEPIMPHFVDVLPSEEDPHAIGMVTYPEAYSTNLGQIVPAGGWHMWTSEEYALLGRSGARGKAERNPYGIVPIVVIRSQVPSTPDFFSWPGEELETAQDNLNVDLTFLNYLKMLQSWGVPVLYGAGYLVDDDSDVTSRGRPIISYGPSTAIEFSKVPKEEKVGLEFVTPDAKIAELQDAIDRRIARVYQHYGLSPNGGASTRQVKSADTLEMETSKLEEYRDRTRAVFAAAIKEIFDTITVVYNTHAAEAGRAELTGEGVQVKFLDASVTKKSVEERVKDTAYQLGMNLKSVVDIYVEDNEGVEPEEAERRILENAETNARLGGMVQQIRSQHGPSASAGSGSASAGDGGTAWPEEPEEPEPHQDNRSAGDGAGDNTMNRPMRSLSDSRLTAA